MAEFPALPLWTDAYLGDTLHLSTTEHGAYLLLLMVSWRTREKSLPDDDRLLARYTKLSRRQWERIRPVMAEFFTIENGRWTQGRLLDEYAAVRRQQQQRSDAGQASALKRKERNATAVQRKSNGASTPTPTPIPIPKEAKASPPFIPPDWVPSEAWKGWLEMRKKTKQVPTERALQLAVFELERLRERGHDPGDVLNQSTLSNWKGLFEVRANGHKQKKPNGIADALDGRSDDPAAATDGRATGGLPDGGRRAIAAPG